MGFKPLGSVVISMVSAVDTYIMLYCNNAIAMNTFESILLFYTRVIATFFPLTYLVILTII